jgi:hypothetical protein
VTKRQEISAHVQGEPVHGDPMANADANRSDLAVFNPHARERPALRRGYSILRQKIDEQSAQIFVQILPAPTQIDNGISDQLPRPVISRLSTAIDREERIRQVLRT